MFHLGKSYHSLSGSAETCELSSDIACSEASTTNWLAILTLYSEDLKPVTESPCAWPLPVRPSACLTGAKSKGLLAAPCLIS